ncbi:MAG: sensor domain-containing diguanylate cyclase [Butyrivibrio sp.]|mgnify:CR=1 FL=1|jgi:diguanylate cyclase (GGDEF)-like protein|nr:sensor domain-containing diguanylate cyclase [Butyrivibrio sp.]
MKWIRTHLLGMINIIIIILIYIFFVGYCLAVNNAYRKMTLEQTEHVTSQVAENIESRINAAIARPKNIAMHMAENPLLVQLLEEEPQHMQDQSYTDRITEYLSGYADQNSFSSVFLVPEYSKRYYYPDGIDRVLSDRNDSGSTWFYEARDSGQECVWNYDYDVVDGKKIPTFFINARIRDQKGAFLGLTGTGFQVSDIGSWLLNSRENYSVDCILMDDQDEILATSDQESTGAEQIAQENGISLQVLSELEQDNSSGWIKNNYVCITPIKNTGWKLITVRNAGNFWQVLNQNGEDARNIVITLILMVTLTSGSITRVLQRYRNELEKIAETDSLTGIPNRKYLEKECRRNVRNSANGAMFFFIFDVDHFKEINDRFGHKAGDELLIYTAMNAQAAIGSNGILTRWGGDEFAGLIYTRDAEKILREIENSVQKKEYGDRRMTVSIGYSPVTPQDTAESMILRADRALYAAKQKGRNRVVSYEEVAREMLLL